MRTVKSPYFILKADFRVNQTLQYGGFIDYLTRKEVKATDTKMKAKDGHYEFENSKLNISQEQYFKYLDYMKRKTALEKKEKLVPDEVKSLALLKKYENNDIEQALKGMINSTFQTDLKEELQTGMFDFYNDDLSGDDIKSYKKKFQQAQENGSVMYRDIISFSTEALILAGVYNPYTNELNREPLIEASRKMFREMYKREGLNMTGITVGEIHYNTKNFHIHYATVEVENTRRMIEYQGELQARGMRKDSTLQAMKSVFATHLFDRTNQLAQISELRNTMRQSVKNELHHTASEQALTLLSRLEYLLPDDKRQWNSKNLTDPTREVMQDLIDELMRSNPEFNRYKRLAKEEDEHRQKMFGELSTNQSSFYEGRMYAIPDGVYYRLGNSILEEMRKSSNTKGKSKEIVSKTSKTFNHRSTVNLERTLNKGQYQLKNMERLVDNDFEQYKIEQERHKLERDIQNARWEQSL